MFEQRIASHAEQIEPGRRNVAEQRHVRRRGQRIPLAGPVQSGCHQTESQLRVGRVVRSADNAEIELLGQRLVLVRAFKIMVEATEEIVPANDRIARLLDPGQIAVFDDRYRRTP